MRSSGGDFFAIKTAAGLVARPSLCTSPNLSVMSVCVFVAAATFNVFETPARLVVVYKAGLR